MPTEEKILPINKYSTYELKAGIDKEIQSFLEEEDFEEIQKFSNIKILFGLLTVACTGVAYLYPYFSLDTFEDYYYIIFASVVGYLIFSTIYWYIDKKLINTIFYVGSNEEYCQKLRTKKHNKIKELTIHSDMDENKNHIYNIWFDFTIQGEKNKTSTEKSEIDCTEVYDERGYLHRDKIIKYFKALFKDQLSKI